jgi:putative ABC transport system permease protein
MNEERFKETFPKVSGYRLFLVDAPESDSDDSTPDDSTPDDSTPDDSTPDDSNSGESASIVSYLEDGLGEQGLDLISTTVILDDLLAVQNTYLSAFQSLGALGLIFGIFGLTAVQLRNVFERRRELALMRAQGFTKKRIGQLVFVEMFVLLIVGLTIGIVSALAAVFPHMVSAGVRPPFGALASWLGVILVTGIISGLVAVRRTISAPVVSALRGE